jgi:drug/metabolite transporter (DMT)-like permease
MIRQHILYHAVAFLVVAIWGSTFVFTKLLLLGCIASMVCFLAWNWVLKKLGAVIATNYVYLNPVVTIVFAWLILSEQITIYLLIGTILILAGMYMADKH